MDTSFYEKMLKRNTIEYNFCHRRLFHILYFWILIKDIRAPDASRYIIL